MLNNRYKNDLTQEGETRYFVLLTNHWLKTRRALTLCCGVNALFTPRRQTEYQYTSACTYFTIDIPVVLTFSAKVFYPTQFVVV